MATVPIEQLFRAYFPAIQRKCTRMLGDGHEAEDVAQETFERLLATQVRGGEMRQHLKWIYQTSTRLAIDRMRRRKLAPQSQPVEILAAAADGSAAFDERLATRQWLAALANAVPEDELEVAILSRIDRLGQAEIAEVSDRSERTVRRMLERFDVRVGELKRRLS